MLTYCNEKGEWKEKHRMDRREEQGKNVKQENTVINEGMPTATRNQESDKNEMKKSSVLFISAISQHQPFMHNNF